MGLRAGYWVLGDHKPHPVAGLTDHDGWMSSDDLLSRVRELRRSGPTAPQIARELG